MPKRSVQLLVATVWLLASASDAMCQPAAPPSPTPALTDVLMPRAFIQAGVEWAVHPALPSSLRDHSAVQGGTLAVAIAGGVRLAPTVALEVESGLERPTTTPLRLESPVLRTFDGEVRDASFGANLRWHPGRKYHIEIVLGGGLVHSRYARRAEFIVDRFGGGSATRVQDLEVNATQASVGGGLAIPIPLGPTIAVVPAVSYRWVRRPIYSDAARLSVGRHVFRVGLSVRRHSSLTATVAASATPQ